ncbi:signal peptidase I [Clostridium oryzae]|uniref:Signal peptidase I n=1 Tax=Clostridium oryzae TaxID=1450648 RepID=A0A1V4IVW7_9CLOT|nr:signal peptidase I [Clostridium oryzae]OPJ63557.1 signal peptidase I T [Clostridium oryzae]
MEAVLNTVKKIAKDYLVPVLIAVVLFILINKFLLFKISIPSSSMYPTLKIGDQAFATRVYGEKSIKRGDILIFYSKELKELLIKRVIGLPGERVKIDKKGQVYINDSKINQSYVKNKSDETGNFKVPAHSYLFLGDNRANSWDSRYWDKPYINIKDIKGKARVIVFPFNRFRFLN